jgi:Transposase, Mutator family
VRHRWSPRGAVYSFCHSVLGLWAEQTEGARFWLGVLNELKTRDVEDNLIAVVDGLKRLPRGDRGGVPTHDDANLHRASDPQRAGDGQLEGTARR